MGYSFTWILNHLSQSYQVASASWAAYAVTASYVPILAGPNITVNYYPSGIAITGSAGGSGTPGGPLTSIQFNSASTFSGSANFTFSSGSNIVYLTGSMIVSGGISASYGANTIGFIGTSSWAQSASNAITASFITASNVWGPYGSSSVMSASIAVTASFAGAAGSTLSASYADYAAVAGTLTDNIWVRSTGDNSAVIDDDAAHRSIADGQSGVAYGDLTYTFGDYASSQGKNTEAIGTYTHAEGVSTYAIGEGSHTEGYNTRTGVEGQPYYPEIGYQSASLATYLQISSSGVGGLGSQIALSGTPVLSIEDPNSSMYGLVFEILFLSASISGSNTIYESSSLAVYDGVSRNLLAHIDLSPWYSGSGLTDGPLVPYFTLFNTRRYVVPNKMRHTTHDDRVYVHFNYLYGYSEHGWIGWFSGSYDGINTPSIYLHNTASLHWIRTTGGGNPSGPASSLDGNNRSACWTGSIASPTAWTSSAPSLQYNSAGQQRVYPPKNASSTWWWGSTYNPVNHKTYITDIGFIYTTANGIMIINPDDQQEYTGSIIGPGSNNGIGTGASPSANDFKLSYTIHGGHESPGVFTTYTTQDPGYKSSLSGSRLSVNRPAVDKNGNIWYGTAATTAGNPINLFALKATATLSSSNADTFAYIINHQNMGISASHTAGPYYYPGDGTNNSERIFVYVNYPYGSGSQAANYKKWLGYDLNGVLRDNPWNVSSGLGTPVGAGESIAQPALYWWEKEKVFIYSTGNGDYILNKDGSLVSTIDTSQRPQIAYPNNLTYHEHSVFSAIPSNRTLVRGMGVATGYANTIPIDLNYSFTQSIVWLDKLITSASVGQYSHAEGIGSAAGGIGSHAEGYYTVATGSYSHAEGVNTRAIASGSHAEGLFTTASGQYSHAEGSGSVASGIGAHTEGKDTIAIGQYSHAEGSSSVAFGTGSHAGGLFTVASGSFQTTIGTYNLLNNTTDLFVIGDGASTASRHDLLNASTGVVRISGSLIVSNSFQLIGNGLITGSLSVSGSISSTSPFLGTASWAQSASQALSSSWTQPGGPDKSIQFNDSNTLSGSANYTFNKSNNQVQLTGSLLVSGTLAISSSNANQTQPAMQVNTQGVLGIGEFSITPTVVVGAIIYSGSEYYLGFP